MNVLNKNDLKKLEIIYIILFSIAFLMRLGRDEVNYFLKYIISLIWIAVAFLKLYKDKFKITEYKDEIVFYFKLFMAPALVMTIYNFFLYISKRADILTVGRGISYIVTMIITITVVFATVYLLKKRALICTIYAMFMSFSIGAIYSIITNPYATFKGLLDTFISNAEAINYFEIHDLTFAFGLIFLLYIINNKYTEANNLKIIIISLVIMLLGFKRIQLLAILMVCIYILLLRKVNEKLKLRIIKITAISLVVACIVYVWSIETGVLENTINYLGINSMGRLSFYKWICSYTEFKIGFLGIGLGASSKMMELYTNWSIATIHSDILRMFAEIGLVGFILWLWYYIVYSYKGISKMFSVNIGFVYFIMTVYLFLLHFTDNTVTYFATQYAYMIIIVVISLGKKGKSYF